MTSAAGIRGRGGRLTRWRGVVPGGGGSAGASGNSNGTTSGGVQRGGCTFFVGVGMP